MASKSRSMWYERKRRVLGLDESTMRTICQKCSSTTHKTFECSLPAPKYRKKESATQKMKRLSHKSKKELRRELRSEPKLPPDELLKRQKRAELEEALKRKREKKKKKKHKKRKSRKRKRRSDTSDDDSDSESSSTESSSVSSSSDSSDTNSDSDSSTSTESSSTSSRDSDSNRNRRRERSRKTKRKRSRARSNSAGASDHKQISKRRRLNDE